MAAAFLQAHILLLTGEELHSPTQIRSELTLDRSRLLVRSFGLIGSEVLSCSFQVQKNPGGSVWFDVGVFRTLFCEVNHFFLPAEGDQVTSAVSNRNPNNKEVNASLQSF